MANYYNSVLRELSGAVNGLNKTFLTPSKYVETTIRVIVNGQVYEYDDEQYGWIEIDDETIEMFEAPVATDVMQAFYQDLDSEHLGLDNVKGSPFDPNGVLP